MDLLVLDIPHPPNPMPRFYISGVSATCKPTVLATLQLTHLVSIGAEPGKILASQFQPGHTFLSFPKILDVEEQDLLSSLLPSLLPFLAATTPADTILVHCQAGQSRSVAAVLMYLIIYQGLTLVDAHAQVARSRPGVCVNTGFLRQLLFLEDFPGLCASPFSGARYSTKEKSVSSFTDTSSKVTTYSQISRRRSAIPCSWAAEHRLYLLSNLFRVTCRLSSLDPMEIREKVENEHEELVKLLIRFGHARRIGPPVKEEEVGEEEEEEGVREEETRGKGWIARCRHCQQLLYTEEYAVRHAGEDMNVSKERTKMCVRGIGGAAPAAERVWGYERELERQPVLHLLPLSHGFLKARKVEEEKKREEVKRRKIGEGGEEGKGEGGRHEKNSTTCRHHYVCPPPWVLPFLLASERGGNGVSITATDGKKGAKNGGGGGGREGGREGGMVSLSCPGRHCGAVVGSMQARPEEGRKEGGGVCECSEALPLVVVRFWEEALRIECANEEEGGREGWKERKETGHGGLCVK